MFLVLCKSDILSVRGFFPRSGNSFKPILRLRAQVVNQSQACQLVMFSNSITDCKPGLTSTSTVESSDPTILASRTDTPVILYVLCQKPVVRGTATKPSMVGKDAKQPQKSRPEDEYPMNITGSKHYSESV